MQDNAGQRVLVWDGQGFCAEAPHGLQLGFGCHSSDLLFVNPVE